MSLENTNINQLQQRKTSGFYEKILEPILPYAAAILAIIFAPKTEVLGGNIQIVGQGIETQDKGRQFELTDGRVITVTPIVPNIEKAENWHNYFTCKFFVDGREIPVTAVMLAKTGGSAIIETTEGTFYMTGHNPEGYMTFKQVRYDANSGWNGVKVKAEITGQ